MGDDLVAVIANQFISMPIWVMVGLTAAPFELSGDGPVRCWCPGAVTTPRVADRCPGHLSYHQEESRSFADSDGCCEQVGRKVRSPVGGASWRYGVVTVAHVACHHNGEQVLQWAVSAKPARTFG